MFIISNLLLVRQWNVTMFCVLDFRHSTEISVVGRALDFVCSVLSACTKSEVNIPYC